MTNEYSDFIKQDQISDLRSALAVAVQRQPDTEAQLQKLDADYRARFAKLPADRRRAITSHDAFGYLAQAYQLTLIGAQGLSTESEPSAAMIAGLIRQIRDEKIPALFIENISNPTLIQQIERETQARVGGELYSDALSDSAGPAPTYVEMMRHNARRPR